MDNLEYLASTKIGKLELGFLIGLKLIALGIAFDMRGEDEYYFSLTLALGFISFNVCLPKSDAA